MSFQNVAKIIAALAEYYDKKLTPTQIAMYVEDLSELSPDELTKAVREYRNDPRNAFFPLPGKLKALIRPAQDPDSRAALIAEQIAGAIARVGPYQTPNLDPVARKIVALAGGWQTLCELITNENLSTYKAQWRMAAKGFLHGGYREEFVALPNGMASKLDVNKLLPQWPGGNHDDSA